MSFNEMFNSYIEQYTVHKTAEIKLDMIKSGIKKHYDQQEERTMKVDGVVARTKNKKEYEINEDIYDFLEDYGYLPLVVKVNKSIEQHFNLEKAKINQKSSLRMYTGGKSIVDKDEISQKFVHYLDCGLVELADEFKRTSTEKELAKSKLEEIKEQLSNVMPSTSVSTEYGTLKKTETYEYDMNVVFDGISGKKEVFIKKNESYYEAIIYPDEKKVRGSGELLLGQHSIEELYHTHNNDLDSIFVKKRPFKAYLKDGFVFNRFELQVDPFEFFRKCEISLTKINDLIQQGILQEKDIEPFRELVNETQHTEIISEGSLEQQSTIFSQKLFERSENIRRRNDENYKEDTGTSSQTPAIDISDFNF
ncbi:hypothetical protein MZM54_01625 [[Brevibacterium] frigoritolerans]|nr:hypothetical protein [Peribacillus frigoritolerans]